MSDDNSLGHEAPTTEAYPAARVKIEPIVRRDLTIETLSRLAKLIGGLKPGARLPTERELCQMLGVGRSTLREVIRTLDFLGVVQVRQGSGTYVAGADDGGVEKLLAVGLALERCSVGEIVEVRRILEEQAARLAALHRTEGELAHMEEVVARMKASAREPAQAASLDLEFHILVARASHNGVLAHLLAGFRPLLELWIQRAVRQPEVIEEIVTEHAAVLRAIADQNPDAARARMFLHLTEAAARLYQTLGKDHSTASYLPALLGSSPGPDGST